MIDGNQEEMVKELPRTKDYKFKGINRGDYLTVHLGSWAPYAKECLITRETRDMGVEGIQFLKKKEKIWSEMSRILGQYVPGIFKKLQLYPVNKPCERFCGAWMTCAVNNGGNDAKETRPHRDVKEYKEGYSCVI